MELVSVTTAEGRIGHCRIKAAGSLLECLGTFGLSHDESEHLLSFGAVYHERERVSSDRLLSPGQYVRVHLQPKRYPVETVDWPAATIHQNDEFVVVNKPAGVPVHPTVDNQVENVLHQLSRTLHSPLYIMQRLDREVSGLIIVAKTRAFQREFNRLLVERRVKKRYRAIVNRAPEQGRHIHYMKPAERSPKTVRAEIHPDWLECALTIDSVRRIGGAVEALTLFEVEIDLETGRTHQIRAQLSAIGSPIIGDILYGSPTRFEVNGMLRRGIALFSISTSWSGVDGRAWAFTLDPR